MVEVVLHDLYWFIVICLCQKSLMAESLYIYIYVCFFRKAIIKHAQLYHLNGCCMAGWHWIQTLPWRMPWCCRVHQVHHGRSQPTVAEWGRTTRLHGLESIWWPYPMPGSIFSVCIFSEVAVVDSGNWVFQMVSSPHLDWTQVGWGIFGWFGLKISQAILALALPRAQVCFLWSLHDRAIDNLNV